MKLRDIKIFTWLSMALLLATTSCHDDLFNGSGDNSDEFTVTLSVRLEGMSSTTRADESTTDEKVKARLPHIAGGSQIDMLVYAVYYDANKANGITSDTPDWQAATEYVKEYDKKEDKPFYTDSIEPGYGQTIIDVSETLQKGEKQTLTLTLKKGQNYQVVFWAQNHETQAFVTDDLKKVQMKYKVMDEEKGSDTPLSVNNDEQRDAFCRSIPLSGDQANSNVTIWLKRPLAQINVGTRGFDFETITRNAEKKYLYSKIRINRAARYLNVVEDYVYTNTIDDDPLSKDDKEAFYTIDYEYNKIPAYWNMEVPKYPSYTIYDADEFSTIFHHTDEFSTKAGFEAFYGNEEFLKVHLYEPHEKNKENDYTKEDEEGYYGYARMGVAGDEESNKPSEVFKYLSMCYILTPTDDEKRDVLTNVKMWLATDADGADSVEVVNLNQVPVQRNRRTNIVGSLLTAKADVEIVVDQDFAGQKIDGDVESGEIVEGFYYDAEKNEFQISSANGLLFFQQLVNGDLCVRQINSTYAEENVTLRGPYPYKTESDTETMYWLKSKSHSYGDFKERGEEEKAKMILKGTGYDNFAISSDNATKKVKSTVSDTEYNLNVELDPNTKWPKYNNFSFFGATVKLMADIDLSGIEWIPIGFDCCNWDSSIGVNNNNEFSTGNDGKELTTPNYRTLVKFNTNDINLQFRRAFCGTFDGNGHTIYNMTTKRFGANVLGYNYRIGSSAGPYDNMQWFGRGFFGLCGPGVEIKNLRLQNVNVQGNNGVAGLVAVVSSADFVAKIENCIVDGGTISATPLYRGDFNNTNNRNYYGRTYARGVYVGGIVGQFSAKGDEAGVTNCEVRNLTISGFRRVGGIIGSIADQGNAGMGNKKMQLNIKVEGNSVANTLMICDQYTPFNYVWNHDDSGIWKNGFGWGAGSSFSPMSDIIVGGKLEDKDFNPFSGNNMVMGTDAEKEADEDSKYYVSTTNEENNTEEKFYNYVLAKNSESNVQYTILSVKPNETSPSNLRQSPINTVRESTIENIPLEYLPMFSSLFVDEVDLTNNYYGMAQLWTKIKFTDAKLWIGQGYENNSYDNSSNLKTLDGLKFSFPIIFPNAHGVNYNTTNKDAALTGMYVETVYLSGENAPGGSSVITPTGLTGENACVMYVTARDRTQFSKHRQKDPQDKSSSEANRKKPDSGYTLENTTYVKDVVLRGSPYAWAGMLFAPNENMGAVVLDNVTIYDVYQTLALERTAPASTPEGQIIQNYTVWPTTHNITLTATDCNFRGYTIPGKGWAKVSYTNTTFEQGSETRYSSVKTDYLHELSYNGEKAQMHAFRTYRADSETTFNNCFFKAPYFIDLSHPGAAATFTECYATSAYKSVKIDVEKVNAKYPSRKVDFIEIAVDTQKGKTIIRYYEAQGTETDKNRPGTLITTSEDLE